jgi:hypothetical protein
MYLWKYLHERWVSVLRDRTIRFTQADQFNDPFEVVPYVAEMLPESAEDSYLSQFDAEIPVMIEEALRENLAPFGLTPGSMRELLLASGQPLPEWALAENFADEAKAHVKNSMRLFPRIVEPTFGREFQRKFGQRFGVLSLTENPTSLLMWAHYANSHQGIAIGFHTKSQFLNRSNAKGAIGRVLPVTYSSERPAVTVYDPTVSGVTYAERLIRQMLLTKSVEWQYEREHRVVLPLDDQVGFPHEIRNDGIHLFSFPPEAVAVVILGARVSEETSNTVRLTLAQDSMRHVSLLRAMTSDTQFALEIKPA